MFFCGVHVIDITCFDEYFIFHVITEKYCFYKRLSSLEGAFLTTMLLRSFKQLV